MQPQWLSVIILSKNVEKKRNNAVRNLKVNLRVILIALIIFVTGAGMVFSASDIDDPEKVVITITPEYTEYPIGTSEDVKIKYTISIKPPQDSYIGLFQLNLVPSDGLTLSTIEDASDGYYLNPENRYNGSASTGIYQEISYSPINSGIFAAGTIAPNDIGYPVRVQTEEIEIMTIVATLPAGSEGAFTLSVDKTVDELIVGKSSSVQYSLDEIAVVTTPVTVSAEIGYNIVGAISTSDNTRDIEVTLQNATTGTAIEAKTLTGGMREFTFTDVANGTYDILIEKVGALPLLIKDVVVSNGNVDFTEEGSGYESFMMIEGDVDGNSIINFYDLAEVRNSKNYNKSVASEGVDPNADIDSNGIVNFNDLSIIRNSRNYNKSAADSIITIVQ